MHLKKQMLLSLVQAYEMSQTTVQHQFLELIFDQNPYFRVLKRRKRYALMEVVRQLLNFRMTRSIWEYPRSKVFWSFFKENAYQVQWLEKFRMTKESMMYIHSMLQERLKPGFNRLQPDRAIQSDEQVAIFLYAMGSCGEYRIIGDVFGCAKSTVCKIVRKVCEAIVDILMPVWVTMPDYHECIEISEEFEKMCNIPQIILVIDGTHIPVTPSMIGHSDFFNRKGWPSIVLQVAVDHRLL